MNETESFVMESAERERKTSELGELFMNRLRRYDKVAYVRFASVYRDFQDAYRSFGYFRPDAVAWDQRDFVAHEVNILIPW